MKDVGHLAQSLCGFEIDAILFRFYTEVWFCHIMYHILQVIILLVLSFTKKRVQLCPNAMRGVPGLIM